jgi:hypothetical protein
LNSSRNLFRELHILPLQSQYIFSLLMLVVKNRDCYITNSDVHTCNTRFNLDLHFPVVNLTIFQKGGWYSSIKIYNYLPPSLKRLSHIPEFKVALKSFVSPILFIPLESRFLTSHVYLNKFLSCDSVLTFLRAYTLPCTYTIR